MSGVLIDDFESFEAATFRTTRPPYVLTSTSSDDPPLLKASWRHLVIAGEPWTNATGVVFVAEDFADLAAGDVPSDEAELERVAADTEQPRSGDFLTRMLDAVSRPTERENTPIAFDPDDYPLF